VLILYTLHLVVMAEVEGFHFGRVLCFVVRAEVGVSPFGILNVLRSLPCIACKTPAVWNSTWRLAGL
jgi:hypothetical protein